MRNRDHWILIGVSVAAMAGLVVALYLGPPPVLLPVDDDDSAGDDDDSGRYARIPPAPEE